MKAIVVHEFGGPEVLKLEEVPTPKPAAGQVLVRVHAVGVNPYDAYMRNGTYAVKPPLPYTPGSDGAGVIESVGPGVVPIRLEVLGKIDPTAGYFTVQVGAFRDRGNAERLREHGVAVWHRHVADQIHGFLLMGRIVRAALSELDRAAAALRAGLAAD